MQQASMSTAQYRHGDHGPAYLIEGPTSDIGVLRLRAGDDMVNHFHRQCDESFIVVEGEVTLYVDCGAPIQLTVGDVARCTPGELHYFRNESDTAMRLVFIKSPQSPGDTIPVPWTPGDPSVTIDDAG
nr:cupin domain-containing protein [Actinomycetales bacterium]